MTYRLTNRAFSRLWRRSKRYSDHEIRFLCKRRGLTMEEHGDQLTVLNAKKIVVANFIEVRDTVDSNEKPDERTRALAALKAPGLRLA